MCRDTLIRALMCNQKNFRNYKKKVSKYLILLGIFFSELQNAAGKKIWTAQVHNIETYSAILNRFRIFLFCLQNIPSSDKKIYQDIHKPRRGILMQQKKKLVRFQTNIFIDFKVEYFF